MPEALQSSNLSYIIEITQRCNYQCLYCYNNSIKTPMQLSLNSFKYIIDEILKLGYPEAITLIGGEPFMHPNLLEFASYLRNKDIHTSISTNGSLINRETIEQLVDNNIVNYEVSLDTHNEECYKETCKTNYSPSDIYKSIRLLKGHGCNVRVATILSSKNLEAIEKLIEICHTLLVDEVALYRYLPVNQNAEELIVAKNDLLDFLQKINAKAGKIHIPILIPIPIESCMLDIHKLKNIKFGKCSCGQEKWFIDARGNLKPCELSQNNFGNIFSTDIKSIISNPVNSLFGEEHKLLACPVCEEFKNCGGGCRFSGIL